MSEEKEIQLSPNVIEMLHEMENVFNKFGVEYYLVGAFARDVQFQTKNPESFIRKTNDIDLAISISNENEYNAIIDALVATSSFTRDEKEIIKLHYKLGIEVDLIPFGEIEEHNREIKLKKPKAFTLEMPGFAETFPFKETIKLGDLVLNTCPIDGLVMLKLISWNDKHLSKDLDDIEKIIKAYFDWNADEIYANYFDVMEKYDTNEPYLYLLKVSAHIIGRKMKRLLEKSPELNARVIAILSKRQDELWDALKKGLIEN